MASTKRTTDPLQHPHLTTAGLLGEVAAGFEATFGRRLEAQCGISVQWFEVLVRLARTPGHRLRMSDLAAQTTLTASGLTRAVDRLVEVGLVRREACPSDRRGAFAVLTEAGERRITEAAVAHLEDLSALFEELYTPAEVVALTDLLHRLRDHVNPGAALASLPRPCVDEPTP